MRKGVKSRAKILSKSFPKISGFGATFPKGCLVSSNSPLCRLTRQIIITTIR